MKDKILKVDTQRARRALRGRLHPALPVEGATQAPIIDKRGFTLVELLIALVITSIIVISIYSVYVSTQKTYLGQEKLVEIQQSARIGMEQMLREIKMVKYLPDGKGCTNGIITANANYIEFDGDINLDGITERVIYSYDSGTKEIKRYAAVTPNDCNALTSPSLELLADKIDANPDNLPLFTYYDSGNLGLSDLNNNGTSLDDITRIHVTVTAKSSEPDPSTNKYKSITFASDVQLRNMGSTGAQVDNPPATPRNLLVTDPHVCGTLTLTWNANTESDLAGYKIYYTTPPGSSVWTGTKTVGLVTSYTLTGLTTDNITSYGIAIAAYDTAGNLSVLTPTVTGSASSSPNNNGPHDIQPNDTTAPGLPTNIDASASGMSVTLKGIGSSNWTPPADTDLAGYNIYRSSDNGVTWSAGPINGGTPVTATTYTDTITEGKCKVYRYKIRSVDTCKNEGADSAIVYGDGVAGGSADVPTGSGSNRTNTKPNDATGPTPAPVLSASAGANEILLSWTLPTDPNQAYEGSLILYATGAPQSGSCTYTHPNSPTVQSSISSGTDPVNGTFSNSKLGPWAQDAYTHSGLTRGQCYYYRAFNYDACWNYTPSTQQEEKYICDDDKGFWYSGQSPPPPMNLDANASTIPTGIRLAWNTPKDATNGVPPDLSGYFIYRAESLTGLFNTDTPTTQTLPLDSARINFDSQGNPLPKAAFTSGGNPQYVLETFDDLTALPGRTYFYAIVAFDCANRGWSIAPYSIATTLDSGNTKTFIQVSPGSVTEGVDFGVSSGSNTSTTLNDTTKSWIAGAWINDTVKITSGTGFGNPVMTISNNTSTSLTISSSWVTTPDNTSRYLIVKPAKTIGAAGQNNIIEYAIQNTSASQMIFKDGTFSGKATILWNNTGGTSGVDKNGVAANLTKISLDDGTTLWSNATGVTTGTQVTFTGNKTFTGLEKRRLNLEFKTGTGLTTINMKGEIVVVTFNYKNSDTNDQFTTTFSFTVPNGPTISNTIQQPPDPGPVSSTKTAGAFTIEAGDIGPNANDCISSTDNCVSVTTRVTPEPGTSIPSDKVILFFCDQGSSSSACGAAKTTTAPDPSVFEYSQISMTSLGGNTYQAFIPNKPGKRIWYFIKATDSRDNDVIDPASSSLFNAFTYDQNKGFKITISAFFPNAADKKVSVDLSARDQDNLPAIGANVTVSLTGTGGCTGSSSLTGTTDASGIFAGTTGTAFTCTGSGSINVTATLTASGFTLRSCSVTLPGDTPQGERVTNSCN